MTESAWRTRPPWRIVLPLVGFWLALATALAAITGRIVDWFVMTDELLYERLAISIAHGGSPFPRVHDESVSVLSQLYPLLIAPVYRHGYVPEALHDAHVLNAFVMASACIPAFLLARRITGRLLASYLVAALTVCVPWIVYSGFLLTEVAAYPAFLWALLALQRATAAPGPRNDLLALAAVALAVLARTQLGVLLVVLPLAIVVHEAALAGGGPRARDRLRAAGRALLARHRLLVGTYAALGLAATGLAAAGRLSDALGSYAVTLEGDLLPDNIGRALAERVATIALGLGVLPFVLGVAWLLAGLVTTRSRERHAFAAVGTLTLLALTFEVASYDLRFGGGTVHDRYLFYLAPVVLVGFAAVLCDGSWPRWSLLAPTGVLVAGFSILPLRQYEKLNVDTPVSTLNDVLLEFAGSARAAHLFLALGTAVAVVLFVQATLLLRRAYVAAVLIALVVTALPAETAYAFVRLFRVDGTAGRPLTLDQGVVFNWVDRTLSSRADVTIVPYPLIAGDFWASVAYWWDLEFWNASVGHVAVFEGAFSWTPATFPKVALRFDPRTGRANVSPSEYVVSAEADARFHIAGADEGRTRNAQLIRAEQPWRADWLTFGLYDDGWSKPGTTASVRVFSTGEQRGPVTRYLTIQLRAPGQVVGRPFRVVSNMSEWDGKADEETIRSQLPVCVPAGGFADVRISTPDHSPIYGDPTTSVSVAAPREGGVGLTQISMADEIYPGCKRRPTS